MYIDSGQAMERRMLLEVPCSPIRTMQQPYLGSGNYFVAPAQQGLGAVTASDLLWNLVPGSLPGDVQVGGLSFNWPLLIGGLGLATVAILLSRRKGQRSEQRERRRAKKAVERVLSEAQERLDPII